MLLIIVMNQYNVVIKLTITIAQVYALNQNIGMSNGIAPTRTVLNSH